MKYFVDTEFIEDGKTIELLSVGIVAEDGREYYAENSEADMSKADSWIKEHVIEHLWSRQADKSQFNAWIRDGGKGGLLSRREIAGDIIRFCTNEPEFYAYYGDYDWIVLCQLYGRMLDLPKGFPMYCRDLKQTLDEAASRAKLSLEQLKAHPEYPKDDGHHHALADAKWNASLYEFLRESDAWAYVEAKAAITIQCEWCHEEDPADCDECGGTGIRTIPADLPGRVEKQEELVSVLHGFAKALKVQPELPLLDLVGDTRKHIMGIFGVEGVEIQ